MLSADESLKRLVTAATYKCPKCTPLEITGARLTEVTMETRKPAFTALETALSAGTFVLPIAFADEVVVVRSNLQQVVVQPVGDPSDRFYDVLTWRLANDR